MESRGFKGVKRWMRSWPYVAAVLFLFICLFMARNAFAVPGSNTQAGTLQGKVPGIATDVSAAATPMLPPTPRPLRSASAVAQNDISTSGAIPPPTPQPLPTNPPQDTAAMQQPPQQSAQQAPPANLPATDKPRSAAQQAADTQAASDRAAMAAPIAANANGAQDNQFASAAADRPRVAADIIETPPPFPYLDPTTEIDVTLYGSYDSDVQSGATGTMFGYIGRDVMDATKSVVVIPHGSKAFGHFVTARIQAGKARVGGVWQGITLPNHSIIALDDEPGADLTGTLGFGASVDNHTRKQLMSVLAYSIIAAAAQVAQPAGSSGFGGSYSPSVGQSVAQGLGTQISQLAASQYNRDSNQDPTAHIVEGAQTAIIITKRLPMQVWQP